MHVRRRACVHAAWATGQHRFARHRPTRAPHALFPPLQMPCVVPPSLKRCGLGVAACGWVCVHGTLYRCWRSLPPPGKHAAGASRFRRPPNPQVCINGLPEYHVEKKLGKGGFGSVYVGRRVNTTKQKDGPQSNLVSLRVCDVCWDAGQAQVAGGQRQC